MSDRENIIRKSGITSQNCMNRTKNDLKTLASSLNLKFNSNTTKEQLCSSIFGNNFSCPSKSSMPKEDVNNFKSKGDPSEDKHILDALHSSCSSFKINTLKDLCKNYGIQYSGTKQMLCNRLIEFLKKKVKDVNVSEYKTEVDDFKPYRCREPNIRYTKNDLKLLAEKYGVKYEDNKKNVCQRLFEVHDKIIKESDKEEPEKREKIKKTVMKDTKKLKDIQEQYYSYMDTLFKKVNKDTDIKELEKILDEFTHFEFWCAELQTYMTKVQEIISSKLESEEESEEEKENIQEQEKEREQMEREREKERKREEEIKREKSFEKEKREKDEREQKEQEIKREEESEKDRKEKKKNKLKELENELNQKMDKNIKKYLKKIEDIKPVTIESKEVEKSPVIEKEKKTIQIDENEYKMKFMDEFLKTLSSAKDTNINSDMIIKTAILNSNVKKSYIHEYLHFSPSSNVLPYDFVNRVFRRLYEHIKLNKDNLVIYKDILIKLLHDYKLEILVKLCYSDNIKKLYEEMGMDVSNSIYELIKQKQYEIKYIDVRDINLFMLLNDDAKKSVLIEYVISNVVENKTFKNALISISKNQCTTSSDCSETELCTSNLCINKNKFTKENKVVQMSKERQISLKDKNEVLNIKPKIDDFKKSELFPIVPPVLEEIIKKKDKAESKILEVPGREITQVKIPFRDRDFDRFFIMEGLPELEVEDDYDSVYSEEDDYDSVYSEDEDYDSERKKTSPVRMSPKRTIKTGEFLLEEEIPGIDVKVTKRLMTPKVKDIVEKKLPEEDMFKVEIEEIKPQIKTGEFIFDEEIPEIELVKEKRIPKVKDIVLEELPKEDEFKVELKEHISPKKQPKKDIIDELSESLDNLFIKKKSKQPSPIRRTSPVRQPSPVRKLPDLSNIPEVKKSRISVGDKQSILKAKKSFQQCFGLLNK